MLAGTSVVLPTRFQCHYGGMETERNGEGQIVSVPFQCHYGGMETKSGCARFDVVDGFNATTGGWRPVLLNR